MSIEGSLTIRLQHKDGVIHSSISSSRPLQASRLFSGKTIDETLGIMPLLFNLCGKAQTLATLRATESIVGQPDDRAIEQYREVLIKLECLREQLWKILLDWPVFLSEAVDVNAISTFTGQLTRLFDGLDEHNHLLTLNPQITPIDQNLQAQWKLLKQTIESTLFGQSYQYFRGKDFDWQHWIQVHSLQSTRLLNFLQQQAWQHAGSAHVAVLSETDDVVLQRRMLEEQFSFTATPDWMGLPQEVSWFGLQSDQLGMSALVQQQGNGIFSRMQARLLGIADVLQQLDDFFLQGEMPFVICPTEKGLAHVNTARGRLTHAIRISGDKVEQLAIVAPTEWNFHPRGVAACGLSNLLPGDDEQLITQARLLIHAIDPCVSYQLDIE